jgi:hypothetical protein
MNPFFLNIILNNWHKVPSPKSKIFISRPYSIIYAISLKPLTDFVAKWNSRTLPQGVSNGESDIGRKWIFRIRWVIHSFWSWHFIPARLLFTLRYLDIGTDQRMWGEGWWNISKFPPIAERFFGGIASRNISANMVSWVPIKVLQPCNI